MVDYGQGALNTAGQQANAAINTGKQDVQNAYGSGQGYINSFNPTDVSGRQLGQGPQNATDYMGAYSSQIAKNPTYQGLYNQGQQMYGVQPLQQQSQYLQNQVNQVAPTQYSLARGFDVSEPQVENAINTNLRFLQPAANAATANYQNAAGLAQGFMNAGIQQNQMNLLPIQSYGQYLNQAQNNEFQSLVSKMNAGVQLSQTEMAQLSALQQAAASNAVSLGQSGATYASTIAGQQAELEKQRLANQYQSIPAGNTLINTLASNPAWATYRAY